MKHDKFIRSVNVVSVLVFWAGLLYVRFIQPSEEAFGVMFAGLAGGMATASTLAIDQVFEWLGLGGPPREPHHD